MERVQGLEASPERVAYRDAGGPLWDYVLQKLLDVFEHPKLQIKDSRSVSPKRDRPDIPQDTMLSLHRLQIPGTSTTTNESKQAFTPHSPHDGA